jgi:hypothetical protein
VRKRQKPNGESSKEFSPLQIFQELRPEFPGTIAEDKHANAKTKNKKENIDETNETEAIG